MDTRSFFLNYEITSLIYDAALCSALERSFEQDRQHSRLVTGEAWQAIRPCKEASTPCAGR